MAAAVGKRRRSVGTRRKSYPHHPRNVNYNPSPAMFRKTRKRRRLSGPAVGSPAVGHRRKRRRVSGTAAVGHRRRKRRVSGTGIGFTGGSVKMKEALHMVGGVAAGIVVNHKVLKPLEAHLVTTMPMAAKFQGAVQSALGIYIAVKGKNLFIKSFGAAVLQGGVNTLLRQFNLEKHIPGISGGESDWTTVKIPINGSTELRSMVAGLLENNKTPSLPSTGTGTRENMATKNPSRSRPTRFHSYVAGDDMDMVYTAKGVNF